MADYLFKIYNVYFSIGDLASAEKMIPFFEEWHRNSKDKSFKDWLGFNLLMNQSSYYTSIKDYDIQELITMNVVPRVITDH